MEMDEDPEVKHAAHIFADLCYNYREQLTAGIICAGWDQKLGGQVLAWILFNRRFTIEQLYMLPILYCQYHSYWCPGSLSRQGISRHGIDPNTRIFRLQHQKS